VRQRNERASTVSYRESGKIPARRWQRSFPDVPVDDAQLRFALEEYALSRIGSLQHRRGIIRKIRLDDKWGEMPGCCLWSQMAAHDRFLERSVNR